MPSDFSCRKKCFLRRLNLANQHCLPLNPPICQTTSKSVSTGFAEGKRKASCDHCMKQLTGFFTLLKGHLGVGKSSLLHGYYVTIPAGVDAERGRDKSNFSFVFFFQPSTQTAKHNSFSRSELSQLSPPHPYAHTKVQQPHCYRLICPEQVIWNIYQVCLKCGGENCLCCMVGTDFFPLKSYTQQQPGLDQSLLLSSI